mmetsp:Transcript_5020/g.6541  ORF Transcript_5020/g.6541 Transcript_5020/m.6541 type:complete len:503 (+) Transcript_5020:275-1783(+)|eukprot:CAMPEP_0204875892 /NCGR_PEP_ID=MMETSP1348-20121228/47151_1 /ASSEMBLY_ACC=CAM_ASM_000700 /TAXON_ID=215587 /ORGANISM="Aplanochytrium stocchinoi, Strain GSBS06" /LENGTH=502 /DNA_ID=CAMNT_0052032549 /DNA_START=207 /DNA_END=1715 /DNA_ORIENTATION=-
MASNDTNFGTCPDDEELYEDSTKENEQFALIALIFCLVYLTIFQIWYLKRTRESEYLRHRFVSWAYIISFGAYLQVFIVLVREVYGRSRFPCVITRQLITSFVVFMAVPVYIRACLFYFKVRLNEKFANIAFVNAKNDSTMKYDELLNGEVGWELEDKSFTFTERIDPRRDKRVSSLGDESDGSHSFYNSTRPSAKSSHSRSEFATLLYLTSTRFGIHAFCIGMIAGLVNAIIISRDVIECSGCDIRFKDLIFIIFVGIFVIPPINYIFWNIRKEPDPLHLKWEFGYILMFVASPFTMAWALLRFTDPYNLNVDGILSWNYVWLFTIIICWSGIYPYQIYRSYVAERDKNLYKGNESDTLEKVLESSIGRNFFKTHLVHEMSIENLLFWKEGHRWRATFDKTKEKKRLHKLNEIYQTFIEADSPLEVNVSGDLKDAVSKAMKENNVDVTTLDDCLNVTYALMARDTFPRFLRSNLYAEYKKESNYSSPTDVAVGEEFDIPSI